MGLFFLPLKTKKTKMTDTTPAQATPDVKQASAPQENESPALVPTVPAACKSLYVADLAPNVTESNLLEVFTRVGQNAIQSIRVCRDSQTGTSLGYAYVNFHRPEDCEKALDVLNFEEINGRPCRISRSNRDPRIRRSGIGNLFVKNIAKDIDHAGLHDVFSTFGEIISCKVATDRITGESKGYGFVHFANPDDAEKAIENLNGKCLNDKQVYVGKFIPRQNRPSTGTGSGKTFTNIYLKNLNKNLTQDSFEKLLEKATGDLGKITSPKLMVAVEDGVETSKGFGFVNFENHEVAAAALERFKDTEKIAELVPELIVEGETLYSNVAMSKTERKQAMESQDKNLYVKNIADSITDEKFKELFEEKNYGTITSAVIMKDEAGTRKGFGFVCYDTKEAASAAKQGMNGQIVAGKPLYVAIAQSKEQRRRQLALQFNRTPMGHPGVPPVGYPGVPHGFFVGGMPAARFAQQPRGNPSFQQRGRVPNFAAGGRGAPVRPYPNMPPQQHQSDFLADFFKTIPETDASQRLGDMLYGLLIGEDKVSEFDAKQIVGRFLQEAQTKPIQQTVEQVHFLHMNPAARRAMIQKYTAPADQQQA